MIIFPAMNELTSDFLQRRSGGRASLLLNVKIDGEVTSVCENTTRGGAWTTKQGRSEKGLLKDYKNIEVNSETFSLSCNDVTQLANELPLVSQAMKQHCGENIPLGNIPRNDPKMLQALVALESCAAGIRRSIGINLTSELFLLRRALPKRICLTQHGDELLDAINLAHQFYAKLPELGKFSGAKRKKDDPSDNGGQIRKWIERNGPLKLPNEVSLDYVEYELKPLRVSNLLKWTCQVPDSAKSDPRRDSVDVLLSYKKSPVFVEVKAAGDSFCSSALVQILYYGSILSAERQRLRLVSQFPQLENRPGWLCVIAQERNEKKEPGFTADEQQTIQFLQSPKTKEALAPHFQGAFLVIVNVAKTGDVSVSRSTTVLFDTKMS